MFKRITIHLSAPICTCEKRGYAWGIRVRDGQYGMIVSCPKCHTKLVVPHEKLLARFDIEERPVIIPEIEPPKTEPDKE